MKIKDSVYGPEDINEPILIELIESAPLQRLKHISQLGLPDEYHFKKGFSRYGHSVGVMILLRRLGAGIEEQVAGLLHDVSHTAFSHVVDWVMGDPPKDDHQDSILQEFIENSVVAEILDKHGFDFKRISNHKLFSLLDQPHPLLCADRIDYTLREMINSERISDMILNSLVERGGRIVFKHRTAAEFFGKGYTKLQSESWGSIENNARYHIFSTILKKALYSKIITFQDLYKTDQEVLNILIETGKEEILRGLEMLRNGIKIEEVEEGGVLLRSKFRHVDPLVLEGSGVRFLSEISEEYKNLLDSAKKSSKVYSMVKISKK